MYINPYSKKLVSDRFFRQKTAYKKFAKELGIEWGKDWNHSTGMNWENMSKETELKLREFSKKKQLEAEKVEVPSKHKYAYVLGINKTETKQLRKVYEQRNKIYQYPKESGK